MKILKQTILTIFTGAYLLAVLFTDISLVGYWTDIIFSIILVSIGLWTVFKSKKNLVDNSTQDIDRVILSSCSWTTRNEFD